VTKLNINAKVETIEVKVYDAADYAFGGLIRDKTVELKSLKLTLKLGLVSYKDPESGKLLKSTSNLFNYNYVTIAQLYKYRWGRYMFFKKQSRTSK